MEPAFLHAEELFRELGLPFRLAVAHLEHAKWLTELGRRSEADALRSAARAVFELLEARPWLERAAIGATAEIAAQR